MKREKRENESISRGGKGLNHRYGGEREKLMLSKSIAFGDTPGGKVGSEEAHEEVCWGNEGHDEKYCDGDDCNNGDDDERLMRNDGEQRKK